MPPLPAPSPPPPACQQWWRGNHRRTLLNQPWHSIYGRPCVARCANGVTYAALAALTYAARLPLLLLPYMRAAILNASPVRCVAGERVAFLLNAAATRKTTRATANGNGELVTLRTNNVTYVRHICMLTRQLCLRRARLTRCALTAGRFKT